MATFITSKTSGSIYVSVNTTTGYWKSYHNGSYNGTSNTPQIYSDSGTFEQRGARLDITGSTGEFTIVSCDVNGNVSGDVTLLNLSGCDIISFDGTGLTGLTKLNIQENQLTSFDATGMTSLIWLYLCTQLNQPPTTALLTNVNVSGLVNLRKLVLSNNKLTWGGLSGLSTLSSLTWLNLDGNSLTQFDGTGLSSLSQLDLFYNQVTTSGITNLPNTLTKLNLRYNRLTTFDATSLTNLTNLILNSNQLTSVNLSGLTQLNLLNLSDNYLPSINVSGLTSLAHINLIRNRLTTIDVSGLTNLVDLLLLYNPSITSSANNQILQQLDQNGAVGDTSTSKGYFPANGVFSSNSGRTSASNTSFNNLRSKNWALNASPDEAIYGGGLNLIQTQLTTFITSKSVGQKINVYVNTSTGYWKYNHNGSDSSIFTNGQQNNIKVANVNGEFEIIPCDSDGTFSGVVTKLNLQNNRITTFNGTTLSSLTYLNLYGNRLTTFAGTGLTNLTYLNLYGNLLTSFNGSTLSSLTSLDLYGNRLTTFNGSGMSNLTSLNLKSNRLTTFNGSGMSNLTYLDLHANRLTTFNGSGMSNLTYLNLYGNRLTTFDGTGLTNLTSLNLHNNRLTSFIAENIIGTGLYSLNSLDLYGNLLTQFDGTTLSSLTDLDLSSNRLTTFDGTGLSSLTKLNLYGNQLTTFIGGDMGLITSLNFQTWNITTLTTFNCAGLSSLTYLYMVYNTGISSIINNQILQDLNTNGLSNGTFMSNNGRTSLSNSNYTNLKNKNWTFNATPNPTIYANGLNVFSWRSFDDDEIIGLPGDTWSDITTDEIPGLYSLQRISGTYSGPAIQIRRSYDNALMDIGFTTDGSLDLTTIYSFVGTASGYLTTFYDQMAAPDNNLTQPQTSAQPIIVSNGVSVSFQMPGTDTSGATSSQPAELRWWRKKGKIIKNLSKPVTMNITEPTEPFLIHFIDSNGNEVKNFSKPVSDEYNSYWDSIT